MIEAAPIRRLTPQQARIAQLIADPAWLGYAEIGARMQPPLSERTVTAYVKEMELVFESAGNYPPRLKILLWVKQLEWNSGHTPRVEELIEASDVAG